MERIVDRRERRRWCRLLESLGIPFEQVIARDAPHSAAECYRNLGDRVMLFHSQNFFAAKTELRR